MNVGSWKLFLKVSHTQELNSESVNLSDALQQNSFMAGIDCEPAMMYPEEIQMRENNWALSPWTLGTPCSVQSN